MSGNREYKSDVFCMLFEDKENALQLYNALNGSEYKDSEEIEICRLDRGISLSVHNDAAFVLDSNLSIWEHQSSVCPNMPVRSLIYFTNTIEKMIKKRNIYGKGLIKIPTPRFAVFYNGTEEQPEQYDLKLSDAFIHPVKHPELELTCRVYNINKGRNKKLLDGCPVLKEYMIFVDYVREYHAKQDYENLEMAINLAIDRCIHDNVLQDFLIENRSEVVKMTQLDYTFDRQIELEREDARREGLEEGRKEGRKEGREEGREEGRKEGREEGREEGGWKLLISQVVKKFIAGKDIEQIVEETEESMDRIRPIMKVIKMHPSFGAEQVYDKLFPKK